MEHRSLTRVPGKEHRKNTPCYHQSQRIFRQILHHCKAERGKYNITKAALQTFYSIAEPSDISEFDGISQKKSTGNGEQQIVAASFRITLCKAIFGQDVAEIIDVV